MANFSQRFAAFLSAILHPFLMAGIMWIYVPLQTSLTGWPLYRAMVLGYLFCLVFPLGYLFAQKRKGAIDDLDIRKRENRNKHYIVFLVLYALQLFVFWILNSPPYIMAFAFAYAFNTTIYALINRAWKISIHGAGVGGPAGALLFITQGGAWWYLLLFPFLGWSRVKLQHHTPMQVVAGITLGLVLVYAEFYLFTQL